MWKDVPNQSSGGQVNLVAGVLRRPAQAVAEAMYRYEGCGGSVACRDVLACALGRQYQLVGG